MAKTLQRVLTSSQAKRKYVKEVQQILMEIQVRAAVHQFPLQNPLPIPAPNHLPLEIVQSILGEVEYGKYIVRRRSEEKTYDVLPARYRGQDLGTPRVAALYLATDPLPRNFASASRITLQMRSAERSRDVRNKARPGSGTFDKSHTWFEVSILRPQSRVWAGCLPPELDQTTFPRPGDAQRSLAYHGLKLVNYRGKCSWMVHHNRAAISDWNNYRVDWLAGPTVTQQCSERHVGDGMGFLSALRPRDRIAIWARAKGSSWGIKVAEALIELSYEKK